MTKPITNPCGRCGEAFLDHHISGEATRWCDPQLRFPWKPMTIRHGGNEQIVLTVLKIGKPAYGAGRVVMAKGNGLFYVGLAEADDMTRLWSPNGYGYDGDAESYFRRETTR